MSEEDRLQQLMAVDLGGTTPAADWSRKVAAKSTSNNPDDWRNHHSPTTRIINGKAIGFYQIGALAHALGRKPVTIRSWEDKGFIPNTPFRTSAPPNTLAGKTPKGRRLYTLDQILAVVRIADEQGVILNGQPPNEIFFGLVRDAYFNIHKRITTTQESS